MLPEWYCQRYYLIVAPLEDLVATMKDNPKGVRFADLYGVCEHHFGKPGQRGSSHAVFKTPWPGNTRANIQDDKGKAKPHQVRQVLEAIDKKEGR